MKRFLVTIEYGFSVGISQYAALSVQAEDADTAKEAAKETVRKLAGRGVIIRHTECHEEIVVDHGIAKQNGHVADETIKD